MTIGPFAAALLIAAGAATAQPPAGASPQAGACPAGTHYATIRHSIVKPGQMAVFERAIAAHNAWYAGHRNATTTRLVRIVAPGTGAPALSSTEAATITIYAPAAMPDRDAAFTAFANRYKASSTIKDEMRVCLPSLAR